MKTKKTTHKGDASGLRGKRVLLIGLGRLGGGVATANWLLKQGARLTIADKLTRKDLAASVAKVRGKVQYIFGANRTEDVDTADLVVLNPDVPHRADIVRHIFAAKKPVENEATLFFAHFKKPTVAITGTRGKTTTVAWTNYFLAASRRSRIVGNSPTDQFLKMVDKPMDVAVVELPSFQLELFDRVPPVPGRGCAPDVAVVTNVFVDHVAWHGSVDAYAMAKAKIFSHQRAGQQLALNADNHWTAHFLAMKPASRVWLFSAKKLARKQDGVFYAGGAVWFQEKGKVVRAFRAAGFAKTHGAHNVENLLAAALAAHLAGASWKEIGGRVATLPLPKFRQETIIKTPRLTVVNDTTATSPDGGIAAIRRFAGPSTVLIAGGTDRELDFAEWAAELKKYFPPERVVLLSGSATDKMLALLGDFGKRATVCDTLESCVKSALGAARKYKKATVVLSPAAKSFEKFKNEYDRGEQFNRIAKRLAKGR